MEDGIIHSHFHDNNVAHKGSSVIESIVFGPVPCIHMLWMQWLEWNCAILVITCHQYCVLCLLFWKGIRFIYMFSDFAVLYTFGWRCVFHINCIFIWLNKWLFMTVIKVFLALARWSWTMIHHSRSCQTNLFPMPNCLAWHFDPCVQFIWIEIFLRKNGGKQWGVSGSMWYCSTKCTAG